MIEGIETYALFAHDGTWIATADIDECKRIVNDGEAGIDPDTLWFIVPVVASGYGNAA